MEDHATPCVANKTQLSVNFTDVVPLGWEYGAVESNDVSVVILKLGWKEKSPGRLSDMNSVKPVKPPVMVSLR